MNETNVLLAVDAGTSTIKTVAFDTAGNELATATRETETIRPEPGHVEQEMVAVWERTAATLREVNAALPEEAAPIGVSITGQGDGLWAITDDGDPVRNAILWSDSRSAGILEEWEQNGQLAAIIDQCGSAPYPGMSLPLLAWLAREEPAQFEQVATILSCKDWLKYKLTGERTLDNTEATVPYLNKSTERYDSSVFELVDLPAAADTLPRLAAPTETIGTITAGAAESTGLEAGLPVVSGVFDVPASAIGSGAATAGGTAVTLGTSLTHQVLVDGAQPETSGIQMSLGLDGLWTYAIGSNAGTPSLEWAAGTFAGDDDVAALEERAGAAPPGSEGVVYHPYLSTSGERGPFVDPNARGQFVGLTPEHDTEHLLRAVYEGLSLAIRDCVEHLPADTGRVTLSGGGSRSDLWCQLIADCLDCPVAVPASSEPGAKGAAVLLALSQAEYPSLEAAVDRMVTIDRRFEPRDEVAAQYEALYEFFAESRREMQSVWADRAAVYNEAISGRTE
ncbi:FGGY-family carbohydrate kinase [Halobellus ordinarius]|uniref:FGGY-family carbohydrate kinase n=1 Tax=Halobellus ordinarius TaxID=3075120 RepID=UPI0028809BC4|nr:FGGY-family carbohydrate kinase [Halobellus sp. ZY16]